MRQIDRSIAIDRSNDSRVARQTKGVGLRVAIGVFGRRCELTELQNVARLKIAALDDTAPDVEIAARSPCPNGLDCPLCRIPALAAVNLLTNSRLEIAGQWLGALCGAWRVLA